MPEGDTIFRSARTLDRALSGQVVTRFETVLPRLARIDHDTPLAGRMVESAEASGKWLHIHFSGDLILLTHMLMSGSWHIYRPGERWQRSRYHMRIVVVTERILAVAFDVPVAEFHSSRSLAERLGSAHLGPSLLAPEFEMETAVRNLQSRPELEIGVALMTQSLVAGIGNIWKSETCYACGVDPFCKTGALDASRVRELLSAARKFLLANVAERGFGVRHEVYQRAGHPCRRCGSPIEMRKQGEGARVTFWCPRCQASDTLQGSCESD